MAEGDVLPPAANAGVGTLPGQVWRAGDPNKHLGPPEGVGIATWSRLFSTRCGLPAGAGPWQACTDEDDFWCPACLTQAGIGFEMWVDD